MGTIANAKVTHYYNCYNGDFIGCLRKGSLPLPFFHTHHFQHFQFSKPFFPASDRHLALFNKNNSDV